MASITSHLLDTRLGRPAAGVTVGLSLWGGDKFELLAEVQTDQDGRVRELLRTIPRAGTYRLTFDTAAYFEGQGVQAFYPSVVVNFTVVDPSQHHHVPLLLSPYGYSTYRGS